MSSLRRPPSVLLALVVSAALAASVALPAFAGQTTTLEDKTGFLVLEAEGRWREVPGGDFAFRATGFLNGVKRVELMATLSSDSADAKAAWTRWRDARRKKDADVQFTTHGEGGLHWIAHSEKRNAVDYVRAFSGADRSAVVWTRASGTPGQLHDTAFAILDKAALAVPKTNEAPAGGPGTEKEPDAAGKPVTFKDADLKISIRLPEGFELNKEVKPDGRRVIATKGMIGTDDQAYVDVYTFPGFDRLDALGWWWLDREHRGWVRPLEIVGEPPAFKILPEDETWTRHVRLLDTKAGLFGIKIDAESKVGPAVAELLDDLVRGTGFQVTRPRPEKFVPPQGTRPVEGTTHTVLMPATFSRSGGTFTKLGEVVEAHVTDILKIAADDRPRGILRVFPSQDELDTAVRVVGLEPGEAAYWVISRRQVWTRADALQDAAGHARLLQELARESVWRRFGFRPPFWVETGTAYVIGSSAYNKGRLDQAHPEILQAARDAIGTTMLFEQVRFWIPERSAENVEHTAIAWGSILMINLKIGPGKLWAPMFEEYVKVLRETARPDAANKSFDLARDVAFVDEWKRFVRKL